MISGGECDLSGDDGLELDRGQTSQPLLSAASVVGAFYPGDDRDPQVVAGGPPAPVQDVLLQEREERLHGGVVAGGRDLAHGPD